MVQEGALTALASVADSSQVFLSTVLQCWIVNYRLLNLIIWGPVGAFPKIL